MKLTLLALILTHGTLSPLAEARPFKELFNFKHKTEAAQYDTIRARVTYYTVGEDKWGSRVACPKTKRAKHGVTVAAHKRIPFGTVIEIPELKGFVGTDGSFIVQDRGGAVNSRKASNGKTMVIDVFVRNKSSMKKLMYSRPMYMNIRIKKNK